MSRQKTGLVTGAAARIGAAITRDLHARGLDVLIHCNSSTGPAEELAAALNAERPSSAAVCSADLSRTDGVEALAECCESFCAERGGALDVLVNNASRFYPTVTGETRAWQWDDLLNSNLRGPYFLIQSLLQPLRKAEGAVINLLDVHARRPMAGHTVYCISKAGLGMLTRALAAELGPEIRVNAVSPGAILWPENDSGAEERAEILRRTALGRRGEPSDIASAVTYLALDAHYVTGQDLAVDGGRLLNI